MVSQLLGNTLLKREGLLQCLSRRPILSKIDRPPICGRVFYQFSELKSPNKRAVLSEFLATKSNFSGVMELVLCITAGCYAPIYDAPSYGLHVA